jgi:serine/threonine protein kinase
MLDYSNVMISGRYRLLNPLRRGGMSEVFLAFDEQMRQQVAIKLVTSSSPDCMKRLQREVRILRKLSHPHILPLLDDGISGPYHYLVTPFMQRGNLRERLAQGKMTLEEAGIILRQVTDALEYAHKQGIIHRDIKPSNILLDSADAERVYLADFGIARILDEASDITDTGCLLGTPEYMAPELAEKPESVSSDVYAVGILLYQMLTGLLPFTSTSPIATYWKQIKEKPTPPSILNPAIPSAVEQVILRALAKDPQRRFPGAQALNLEYVNALIANNQPTSADIVMPALPPTQVTMSKIETGFAAALPASFWRNRAGRAVQRGILIVTALLLLALPVSLGILFGHYSAQLNQPLSINEAFISGTLAGEVLPATQTKPVVNNGAMSHLSWDSYGEHKHRRGHGNGGGND